MPLCHSPHIHNRSSGIVINLGKNQPEKTGSERNTLLRQEDEQTSII
jgi:hypothetical protein